MAEQQAPAPAPAAAKPGPVNDDDVNDWKARINDWFARPSEHINAVSPAGAQKWNSGFFEFWNPIETCALTCCLPCVTFGKTHHRIRKNANLEGYEPINTSCLVVIGTSFICLSWLPLALQRADIRTKYNLEGDGKTDLLWGCCCGLCNLVQQDKEAAYREGLLAAGGEGVQQQGYQSNGGMEFPPAEGAEHKHQ